MLEEEEVILVVEGILGLEVRRGVGERGVAGQG